MKRSLGAFVIFAVLATFPCSLRAQSEPSIQALLDARVAGHPGDGIVAGVINHGVVSIYQAGSSGNARPLDDHTLFEIGSDTKTFTALVLSELVADGKVALTDPVSKYLPSSVHVPSLDGKKITLLNLATQHSGLPRMPSNFSLSSDSANPYVSYSVGNLYAFLNGYTLTRDPGATFEYSNLGVGLLGLALSHAVGTDYESMVRSYIWKPLGMNETRIALAPSDQARFAVGHDDADQPVHSWEFTDAFAGAGSIRSDVHDMLLYLNAAMGHGPLGPAMLAAQQPRQSMLPGFRIGLVWWTDERHHLIQHGGDTAGYHAMVMISADRTRGVVILSNGLIVSDIAGRILDPKYPLLPKRHNVSLPVALLNEYVGTYKNPRLKMTFVIARQGENLTAKLNNQDAAVGFASRPDHFYNADLGAYVEFVRVKGKVVGLVLIQSGQTIGVPKLDAHGSPLATTVVPDYPPVVALDATTLASYAGSYLFSGTAVLTITLKDGHLFAQLHGQPQLEIFPSAKDSFYLKVVDAQVVFVRNAAGKIVSLRLDQNGRSSIFTKKPDDQP